MWGVFASHFSQSSLSLTSVSELSLIVSLSMSKSYSVSCSKETVLGLHQIAAQ